MPRPTLAPLLEPLSLVVAAERGLLPPLDVPPKLRARSLVVTDIGSKGIPSAQHTAPLSDDGRVDLALVAVAPEHLLNTLRGLETFHPRAVVVHSLAPPEHKKRDAAQQWAREHDCLLLGPHSFGLQRPWLGLNASQHPTLVQVGRVALITQSSAITAAIMDWADDTRAAFSAIVSLGDTPTVSVADLLDYFAFDAQTDAIALYLEDPGPARQFMSALRGAARVKPVVVLRAGRSVPPPPGSEVPPDAVFDAALRRAGALRVRFFVQLFSALKALGQRKRPRGVRLAVLTNGDGPVQLVQDSLLVHRAVRRAVFEVDTRQQLTAQLSPQARVDNPVIEPAHWTPEAFRSSIECVLADPGVDALLLLLTPDRQADLDGMVQVLLELVPQSAKPLIVCLMGDASMRRLRGVLESAGIPAFRTPETAADAFGHLVRFHANQQLLLQTQSGLVLPDMPGEPDWLPQLQARLHQGNTQLPTELRQKILATYDLAEHQGPAPRGAIAAVRAQVFRDPGFGAVMLLQPSPPWPAPRSDSLELLPLNGYLARRLIERGPLWRDLLAAHATPVALEKLERRLLHLSELAVDRPELDVIRLDPILITDDDAVVLNGHLECCRYGETEALAVRHGHLAIAPYPSRWCEDRELADGTPYTLRPIRPEDGDALQRFVRDLSSETRYMRFISTLRELPPKLLARYTQIDYDREVALVITVEEANPAHRNHPHETIIGLAHYLRNADGLGAEYALVIADAWQRRGLGPALMTALISAAQEQGLTYLEGQVLANNHAMLRLMRRLGFEDEPDPYEATLRRTWRHLGNDDAVQRKPE